MEKSSAKWLNFWIIFCKKRFSGIVICSCLYYNIRKVGRCGGKMHRKGERENAGREVYPYSGFKKSNVHTCQAQGNSWRQVYDYKKRRQLPFRLLHA